MTCRWTARLRWSCAGSIRSPGFPRSGYSGQVGRAAQICPTVGSVKSLVSGAYTCMHGRIRCHPAMPLCSVERCGHSFLAACVRCGRLVSSTCPAAGRAPCLAGHDEINIHGVKEHESYRGDRTQASLTTFADNLVPSAGQPHHYIRCHDRPCCQISKAHSRLHRSEEQGAHASLATSAYALIRCRAWLSQQLTVLRAGA